MAPHTHDIIPGVPETEPLEGFYDGILYDSTYTAIALVDGGLIKEVYFTLPGIGSMVVGSTFQVG